MAPNKPIVIDIYHGDNVVDFAAVKASGIIGVIHKASQGAPASSTCPMPRGASLRWRPGSNGARTTS
jgi:hypothetical protein